LKFPSKHFVVTYHGRLIDMFGGMRGVRDEGLLDSALAQPCATMLGVSLHETVWEVAAAYGFHLCKNHPFIDGNKRIAAVAMATSLAINQSPHRFDEVELYLAITSVADGTLSKQELARWLEAHAR
jgi:death-on-curing protein